MTTKFAKRKAEAEARRAVADADKAEIELARLAAQFENEQAVAARRVYNFVGGVDDDAVAQCLDTLVDWSEYEDDAPWRINLNSPGGHVDSGSMLFDEIHAYSKRGGGDHEITIAVRGFAASMAAVLLQAADVRLIGRSSMLMLHQARTGVYGTSVELRDELALLDKLTAFDIELFLERSSLSRKQFEKKLIRHDWWLNANEALQFGFVDRIG